MRTLEAERKNQHRHITIRDERDVTMREGLWIFLTPQCSVFAGSSGRIMEACLLNGFSARTQRVKLGPLTVELHANSSQVVCGEPILPFGRVPTEMPLLEGHV